MLIIIPANRVLIFFQRAIVCTFLLLTFSTVEAQVADTSVVTVDEGIKIDEPDEDEDYTGEEEDEKDFRKISEYSSQQYGKRQIPANAIKEMQDDDAFWYANGTAKKGKIEAQPRREEANGKHVKGERQQSNYTPLTRSGWFQTLMWIIIVAGFAGAIIWYLADSKVGLFRKKSREIATVTDNEEMPEDIFAINYQKEIDKAASQGNYRLAIRLMYLRLLKNLAEKNIIQYKQDRTNLDYLMQLHPTTHYKEFFRITRHYEYSWYGKFDVSNEAYGIIRTDFDQFEKTTR